MTNSSREGTSWWNWTGGLEVNLLASIGANINEVWYSQLIRNKILWSGGIFGEGNALPLEDSISTYHRILCVAVGTVALYGCKANE